MDGIFRLKPLEWKTRDHNSVEGPVQYANTANGEYVVKSPAGPFSRCWVNGIPYMDEASCKQVAWLGHLEALQAKWITAVESDS